MADVCVLCAVCCGGCIREEDFDTPLLESSGLPDSSYDPIWQVRTLSPSLSDTSLYQIDRKEGAVYTILYLSSTPYVPALSTRLTSASPCLCLYGYEYDNLSVALGGASGQE